jgi:hypothetical protein
VEELASWLAIRQSYETVEDTVARFVGERVLSDQKIQDVVVKKAQEVSRHQYQQVKEQTGDRALPAINRQVPLYEEAVQEVLFFEDGIQVKAQKAERDRQPRGVEEPKRVNTDVGVLELPGGESVRFDRGGVGGVYASGGGAGGSVSVLWSARLPHQCRRHYGWGAEYQSRFGGKFWGGGDEHSGLVPFTEKSQ